MNAPEKTHFRKAFNSPYLSSADIVEPTQLIVARVTLEKDRSKKTKDLFNTAHFSAKELRPGEPLKPMILNATNSKMMKTLTGSPFIDDWNDIPVTVWVDQNVKFGRETTEGLRLAKAEKADPASKDQIATIQDYKDTNRIEPDTLDWLEKNGHKMDRKTAQRLIDSLRRRET